MGNVIELKHSKKFFFRLDPQPVWNNKARSLRISGWCIAKDGTPLKAIRARVPEIFETALDRERPEVTKYFSGAQASTRCGFVLDLKVPKRRSRLAFDAADANGNWQQVFFSAIRGSTILGLDDDSRWQEVNARMRYDFSFERPAIWTEPVRMLYVVGWCVDRTGAAIQSVRARIGSRVIPANYGIERVDIAERYPNFPNAKNSGFAIAIPVPRKGAALKLELQSEGGEWRPFLSQIIPGRSRTATADQLFAPPAVEFFIPYTTEKARFQFWLDRPSDWSKRIRYLRVSGWCLTTGGEPVVELRGRVRGKIFPARYGIRRPDVAKAVGNQPGALCSGFSLNAVVPRGPGTFVLEARRAQGPWEEFFQSRINGPLFREATDIEGEQFGDYATWIRKYDRLTRGDGRKIRRHIAQFKQPPVISVLLPTYNSNLKWLRHAIESVREQIYPNWELCIADDASTDATVWPFLQKLARRDRRIKIMQRVQNGGIAAASNDALRLANGNYIALLDHDDELAPTAFYHVALELNRDPQLQLLYSDEDKLDRFGRRCDPHFKPDWSPALLLSQNYISHLSVYSSEIVRKVGGFREGFAGAQDYDLALRCVEQIDPSQIRHIPRILYHWRADDSSTALFADAKPDARHSALRVVQEHLDRENIRAVVEPNRSIYQRVRYKLPGEIPLVSIIIPTRDRLALLRMCVQSIFDKTDYPNYEIIIIDNESSEAETKEYLDSLGTNDRVTVCAVEGAFNYSSLNNRGVEMARGSLVALLNNDIEVTDGSWLGEMVGQALRPEVGAVGARLRYPDGTIQHGGVILGAGGIAGHAHSGIQSEDGYFSRPHLVQNLSAVTAACMLIKRTAYLKVGGFDEVNLPVAFNDVDFCLRLRQEGFEIVWTPHAELYHHESASRGFEDTIAKQTRFLAETDYMRTKWGPALASDPFYNPNLSLGERLFMPAFPPRLTKPWLGI